MTDSEETWTEVWDEDLHTGDPLAVPGYGATMAERPGDSVRAGLYGDHVRIEGRFDVVGGSMGAVHGEKVCRAFDRAVDLRLPVVCVTRSGGARMQEGMVSLVQLGRTVAAVERHRSAGLLSVAVLRSPTTGGVWASYASRCQIRVAEAGAVVGFAGPRVVADAYGQDVSGRSHSAETALTAGLVDDVLPAEGISRWLAVALGAAASPLAERPGLARPPAAPTDDTAWAAVEASRRRDRPTGIDVAAVVCDSWVDLAAPDPTIRTALASIGDEAVVVVACDRHAADGRPTPQGFRQARRAIGLAGELGRPLLALVDTPGAAPHSDSENDGIAAEIAATFAALDGVDVPTVGLCVGEGGSGGALALGWTDALLIQRSATFSVMAPEGAAIILRRDATQAPVVSEQLGLTSARLLDLGVVDEVVPDDSDGTRDAVQRALRSAKIGRRRERPDAVTAGSIRTE